MRFVFAVVLFFIIPVVHAQSDSTKVKERVARLENALIAKDYREIDALLHKDVSFGHSTGWVQSGQDVINDCRSGKLAYQKIERNNLYVAAITKDWATIRYSGKAEGLSEGNAFTFSLHVLQVWVKDKEGKWQLAARQATRLPEQ